jgi:hypothetical protein
VETDLQQAVEGAYTSRAAVPEKHNALKNQDLCRMLHQGFDEPLIAANCPGASLLRCSPCYAWHATIQTWEHRLQSAEAILDCLAVWLARLLTWSEKHSQQHGLADMLVCREKRRVQATPAIQF